MKTKKTAEHEIRYKMRRFATYLLITGFTLVFTHYIFLKSQQVHNDENWLITLDGIHTIKQAGTIINIQPPYESENIRLISRNLSHAGLRIIPPQHDTINRRGIRLRANKPGTYQVSIEYALQLSQNPKFHAPSISKLDPKKLQLFLSNNEWLQLEDPVLEKIYKDTGLNKTVYEKLPERIFEFVQQLPHSKSSSIRTVINIISSGSANHRERALLMVALCRKSGIPSRVITGLKLQDDPSAYPDYWVEVYIDDQWISYHPGLGYRNKLPVNYIALDKYGDGIVSASIKGLPVSSSDYVASNDIMIERMSVTIGANDKIHGHWYQIFMLDRLSVETRNQLSLLMLLPLGALLCSIIRQVVGLHSYGVFTPTILALAITYTEIETTVLILAITMVLVYFGRPTFHQEMSRTPRLSIIFTLVAIGMVIGVSILDYFSLATDGHLVLLPIVIITSLIDRFFSAMELHGNHIAFIRLLWTFILMLAVLPILQLIWLGEWILRYPEFHLITLSLLILVAYYPFGKHKLPTWLSLLSEPEKTIDTKNGNDQIKSQKN